MDNDSPPVNESPSTPTSGPQGSDLRSVAGQIEGLLDGDGQFNPRPDAPSRAHPDYDESSDGRAAAPEAERDERGRFKAATPEGEDENPAVEDDTVEGGDLSAASDDPNEDTGEPGDTDEGLATSADDAATNDEETANLETLEQLAAGLDIPIQDLKDSISHTFKAADQEVTVTLSELEAGYQKDADYRRSTAKLAEDRIAAETEISQRNQAFEQHFAAVQQNLNFAEQMIGAELNDPRFAQLRESDPAEWTARREEVGQRLGALRQNRERVAAELSHYQIGQLTQLKERETHALQTAVPDFSNEKRDTARSTLANLGYTENEVGQMFDHRVVVAVLELAELRKENAELKALQESATETVKRVKKDVPKLTKPGKQRRSGARVKQDNLTKLRQRAAKSGKIEDAAAVIEAQMN